MVRCPKKARASRLAQEGEVQEGGDHRLGGLRTLGFHEPGARFCMRCLPPTWRKIIVLNGKKCPEPEGDHAEVADWRSINPDTRLHDVAKGDRPSKEGDNLRPGLV